MINKDTLQEFVHLVGPLTYKMGNNSTSSGFEPLIDYCEQDSEI